MRTVTVMQRLQQRHIRLHLQAAWQKLLHTLNGSLTCTISYTEPLQRWCAAVSSKVSIGDGSKRPRMLHLR